MSVFFSWRTAILKSDLEPTTRHVLLTLSCHMNDAGESCYPSVALLCDETGLSNRAVITHLKKAVESGWIEIDRHGFGDRRYWRNEYKMAWPSADVQPTYQTSEKTRAHKTVGNAVKSGKLEKLPCEECGDVKSEAHHDDYSKPLDVRWLCRKCHRKHHKDMVNDVHYVEEGDGERGAQDGERSDNKTVNDVHTSSSINYSNNNSNPRAQESTQKIERSMRPEGMYAIRLIDLGVAVTSMHPTLCKWVIDGVDLDLLVECVGIARLQKPEPEKIAPNYLDAVLRTQLAERVKPKVDNAWMHDDRALERKGRELGVSTKPGESYVDYRKRVKQAVLGDDGNAA